jgi:hypothetical protein
MNRWWLVLALCLVCSAVRADDDGKGNKDDARNHFRQGVTLVREGAYRAALVELKRAYEISPDFRVLFNIGQCELQLGEYVAAITAFDAYLAQGGDKVEPERRAAVEEHLRELQKRVANLNIQASVSGAEIRVDGVSAGQAPLKDALRVSVGRHEITASTDDGRSAQVTLEVAGGDTRDVELELTGGGRQTESTVRSDGQRMEQHASAPEGMSRKKKFGIGLLAGGGGLLIGSVITGVLAKNAHDEHMHDLKSPRGNAGAISSSGSDTKTYAALTDALIGAGVACAVTGVVLMIVGKKEKAPAVSVGLTPSRLVVQGRF